MAFASDDRPSPDPYQKSWHCIGVFLMKGIAAITNSWISATVVRRPAGKRKIPTIPCPDEPGIVAVVSGVLARAGRWHAERRVLLTGVKTVVFR